MGGKRGQGLVTRERYGGTKKASIHLEIREGIAETTDGWTTKTGKTHEG